MPIFPGLWKPGSISQGRVKNRLLSQNSRYGCYFTAPNQKPCMARLLLLLLLLSILGFAARGQQPVLLRGVVYDSSRMVTVPSVKVTSTNGAIAYTDSIGHYSIMVGSKDSVSFYYRGRSTAWFSVREIKYPAGFDIALQVNLPNRYQTLKEARPAYDRNRCLHGRRARL